MRITYFNEVTMEENTIPKSPDEIAFEEMNIALNELKDKRAILI